MKLSSAIVVMVILSLISSQLFAGDIDLTGLVINSTGVGIKGATVELISAGLSTTTDSLGHYTLESEMVTIENGGLSYVTSAQPQLSSGLLSFEVGAGISKVTVDIYSLSGRKVLSPLNSKLASGNYTLSNLTGDLSSGAYIVKTTIGIKTFIASCSA